MPRYLFDRDGKKKSIPSSFPFPLSAAEADAISFRIFSFLFIIILFEQCGTSRQRDSLKHFITIRLMIIGNDY